MEWINSEQSDVKEYIAIWQSQPKGLWRIGMWPVLFGVRVIAWREGSCGRSIDYCAGNDSVFLLRLLHTIKAILSKYPEDVSESEIEATMPPWETRPISGDPACWGALQRLAETPAQNLSSC